MWRWEDCPRRGGRGCREEEERREVAKMNYRNFLGGFPMNHLERPAIEFLRLALAVIAPQSSRMPPPHPSFFFRSFLAFFFSISIFYAYNSDVVAVPSGYYVPFLCCL